MRAVLVILAFGLLACPVVAAAFMPSPLTLAQAQARARAANPLLAESEARIEQAREALREAAAPFWPQLSAYAEYLRGDAPSAFLFKTIDARRLPEDVDFNQPGTFGNLELGARARLNLFAGGADLARRAQAREQLGVRRGEHAATRNDLAATVSDTFYALLAAEGLSDVAAHGVEVTARELQLAEARLAAGGALRAELLLLQARLAEARAGVLSAAGAVERLRATLALLLELDTAALPPLAVEAEPVVLPPSLAEARDLALTLRPELSAARHRQGAAHLQLRQTDAAFLPRLDLEARLYHDDPGLGVHGEDLNWTLGALLNWELFSGFAHDSRRQQGRALSAEARAAEQRLRRQIVHEVESAWLDYQEATALLEARRAAAAHAEAALELVGAQYRGGSALVSSYLQAELGAQRARMEEVASYWRQQRAAVELLRATGAISAATSPQNRESGNLH